MLFRSREVAIFCCLWVSGEVRSGFLWKTGVRIEQEAGGRQGIRGKELKPGLGERKQQGNPISYRKGAGNCSMQEEEVGQLVLGDFWAGNFAKNRCREEGRVQICSICASCRVNILDFAVWKRKIQKKAV